jgi:parallel beta-helix repeat protein
MGFLRGLVLGTLVTAGLILLLIWALPAEADPACIGTTYDGLHVCTLTAAERSALTTPTPVPRQVFSNPTGNCYEVIGKANVVIENIDVGPCGKHGILVYGSSNVTIRNVRVRDAETGILVLESSNVGVGVATITNTSKQLVVYDKSNGGRVSGVNVGLADAWTTKVGWDGLSAYFSNNIVFEGNELRGGMLDTGCGIIIDGEGSGNIVRGNVIANYVNCGIAVTDGTGNLVENNRISNCIRAVGRPLDSCGIYVWEPPWYLPLGTCKGNVIRNNIIEGRGPFYWDGGTCTGTIVTGNSWQ